VLFGAAEAELLGSAVADLWAPAQRPPALDLADVERDAMMVRRDGSEFLAHVTRIETSHQGRPAALTLIRDGADPAVRWHAERMQVLYDASHAFARDVGDPERVLDAVARACSSLVGDFASVMLLGDGGTEFYQAAMYHPDPEQAAAFRAVASGTPLRLGEGVMGRVLVEDRPVLMRDVDPEALVATAPPAYKEAARRLGVRSFIGVPMRVGGRIIGGIALARSRAGAPYDDTDVAYLQDLADRAALALENARLYASLERRVRDATAQLTAANQQLLDLNASLGREVAEHKETARALRYSRDRAERASRELEVFSYSVAHDLRAPLRSIDGFSQALVEDYGERLDADGLDALARVRAAAQRMASLIDDLLALSRISRAEVRRERVDLSALATAIVARLRRACPERGVEVAIEPGMVADADPRLVEVALGNLLGNAWKFTARREGARIEVAVRRGERPPVFVVRDNGAGFDPEFSDKLFGVFQRLHTAHEFEGNGVGLATVERVVRLHGGRIWAEGAVDQGATFSFTLEDSVERR
jgi:signal transduction histidine kinase